MTISAPRQRARQGVVEGALTGLLVAVVRVGYRLATEGWPDGNGNSFCNAVGDAVTDRNCPCRRYAYTNTNRPCRRYTNANTNANTNGDSNTRRIIKLAGASL